MGHPRFKSALLPEEPGWRTHPHVILKAHEHIQDRCSLAPVSFWFGRGEEETLPPANVFAYTLGRRTSITFDRSGWMCSLERGQFGNNDGLEPQPQILAKTSGRRSVEPGDFIEVTPDRSMTYDPQGGALHRRVREHWGENARLWDPDRVILVADHFLDRANPVHVERQAELDAFARAYGVEHYYPVGAANYGICHALLPEDLIRPGELIAGTDSHSSTYGGFGAIGLNVGIDAMRGSVDRPTLDPSSPQLRIEISGRFPKAFSPRM